MIAYLVANPDSAPDPVLVRGDREWWEGDEIDPDDVEDFAELLARGHVLEVEVP